MPDLLRILLWSDEGGTCCMFPLLQCCMSPSNANSRPLLDVQYSSNSMTRAHAHLPLPCPCHQGCRTEVCEESHTCLKRSRTREAPTPTNISTNSEALMDRKLTPASPATALASRVLPVPGGPHSSTPLGMRAPDFLKRWGFRKKSTTSISSFCSQANQCFLMSLSWCDNTPKRLACHVCQRNASVCHLKQKDRLACICSINTCVQAERVY